MHSVADREFRLRQTGLSLAFIQFETILSAPVLLASPRGSNDQ